MASFFDRSLRVKRQPCISLRRDSPRHDFKDVTAEGDQEVVDDVFNLRGAAEPAAFAVRDHLREEVRVILFLRRGKDQTWIGRGVLRFEILDRLEIAGIGDHFRKFLQLIELAQFRFGFFVFGDGRYLIGFLSGDPVAAHANWLKKKLRLYQQDHKPKVVRGMS